MPETEHGEIESWFRDILIQLTDLRSHFANGNTRDAIFAVQEALARVIRDRTHA